ncbi:hypothetical protein [Phaeospirillum tilakii]|uniref:Meckel syndrome type 1 protein n=1 Tax=Phaeospirillum tilakii TaxID=741673 RepID=A0ABW5C8C9_9PROT
MPDSLNPVSWYHDLTGGDEPPPEIATPRRADGSAVATPQGTESGAGLPADRSHARYAETVRREPAPTKRLVRRVEPAAAPQVADATVAPPPAPAAIQAAPLPVPPGAQSASVGAASERPSLDRPMRTAREDGPTAPTQIAGGPPDRPNVPDSVPTRRNTLTDTYQQRLRESAAATSRAGDLDTPPSARSERAAAPAYAAAYAQPATVIIGGGGSAALPAPTRVAARSAAPPTVIIGGDDDAATVRLTPPRGLRGARGVVVPPGPAASFEVALFQPGRLGEAEFARLREVAALQRRSGGTIHLEGAADPELAHRFAAMLGEMGVPARKIRVATSGRAGAGLRVLMEY